MEQQTKIGYVALIGTVGAVRARNGTAEIVTDSGRTERLHDCSPSKINVLGARFASRVLVVCTATRSEAGRLGSLVPLSVDPWDPPDAAKKA